MAEHAFLNNWHFFIWLLLTTAALIGGNYIVIQAIRRAFSQPGDASMKAAGSDWKTPLGVVAGVVTVFMVAGLVVSHFHPEPPFYLGQKYFSQGDYLEITSVQRSANQMTVKGYYVLASHDQAMLALYITTRTNIAVPVGPDETKRISKGRGDFELTDPHLVPGLPHLSMYATNGQPFAALYFGTKTEALAESHASWITNALSASAETWSPSLVTGGKPDLQLILDEAKNLMEQGHYEDALQRQIWYFNHALEYDQGQTGVRLSFALSQWLELARRYPRAKAALIEIRDQDTRALAEGKGYANLFADVVAINRELQDEDATYALFKTVRAQDPQLAGQCYFWVENLLVAKGEYQFCYDHMGDPQFRFDSIRQVFDLERANQERMAETQQTARPMVATMMKKSAEDRFVEQMRQLIDILVATGHQPDAEKIRAGALAVLDDARLQSAVSDSEKKLRYQPVQNKVAPPDESPAAAASQAAVGAAEKWLAAIDDGNYSQSWKDAAAFFQAAVTEPAWKDTMESVRKPLGGLVSRQLKSAQPATSLPGAPDGEYLVMQFDTSFAAKKTAVETVTFTHEKDGAWRASGYYIR
jgi:serine/threonine-protein kinase